MNKILCNHPEMIPTQWNQSKPEPVEMIGPCEHNMICPICGWGWGCSPDPCEDKEQERLTISQADHERLLEQSMVEHGDL